MFNFDYYTIWSNLLFYIILILHFIIKLPQQLILFAIVNMIMVGIVGNIIFNTNMTKLIKKRNIKTKACKTISIINMITHTLPLVLAILWLFLRRNYKISIPIISGSIIGLMLLWSVIPDKDGKILLNKANNEYGNPNAALYSLIPLSMIAIIWFIHFMSRKRK